MGKQKECGERAPETLIGDLGPLSCSKILGKDGTHTGEHKAHRTVARVGRLTVMWKQAHHAGRPRVYRPEVVLPAPEATHLYGLRDPELRSSDGVV